MSEFMIENRIRDQAETIPPEERRKLQLQRLREVIERVSDVPFYKEAFQRENITSERIRKTGDIRHLPFTTKADLRDNSPLGMLTVPKHKVKRIHGSSGTTGKPIFVAYTVKDLQTWAELCARFLVAGGLKENDLVQIAFGYGLFTGGFGLHYGVERAGAGVLPASAGKTQRQISLMQELRSNVLVATPSYALTIADAAEKLGIAPRSLPIQYGHFGAEPWTENMRDEIESQLGILAFNNYGLSEVVGPGVSGDCAARDGMHIQEDHFLVECIDPKTMEPVQEGEQGELVFTTLTKEAMPLIRYRTGDISSLFYSPCTCGRTTIRMSRVTGRTDDMLIIRGVNVFPSQIEAVLLKVEGTTPHYQIIVDRPRTLDQLTVKVEIQPRDFSDELQRIQSLRNHLAEEIHEATGVRTRVELVAPNTLERFKGKAKRVEDRRKLK